MAAHHPLASLATLFVVSVCAVGALPLGWYGSGYYPTTSLGAPYLGQFSYFNHYPLTNVNLYNPYQRFLGLFRPGSTKTYGQDIPSSLVTNKGTNWVLTIMKWPGWDTVITDDKTKKEWKKLIGSLNNYTDINNPQWSKQLRQWIEKQPNAVSLFTKVSHLMTKSPQWEKNIKVWLNFTSISADYVNSFKRWLKNLISESKPKKPHTFPGPMPPFPSFPRAPWAPPPPVPWNPSKNLLPGFGMNVDPQNPEIDPHDRGMIPGMMNPGVFEPGQPPSGPIGMPQFFNPQPCTGYDCPTPSPNPPNPNFPQAPFPDFPQSPIPNFPQPSLPNFPQSPVPGFQQPSLPEFPQAPSIPNYQEPPAQDFPQFQNDFPQFQPPGGGMMFDMYPGGLGFGVNPFSGGGFGPGLPTFGNIRQRKSDKATANQSQNKGCPQCAEISIILDLRRSNTTFCKIALTAPRQSLKNFFILASFENTCFNLTTKVRDSRLWGQKGEYIFSLNGLSETIFNYWIAYQANGTKDTELNFQPQNGDHIIVDYTNWMTIVNKIASPK